MGDREVAECCFDLLFTEVLRAAQKDVSASSDGMQHELTRGRVEAMGFDVGFRKVARSAAAKPLQRTPLELIKFICKDFWSVMFQKHADRLQTNRREMFVLNDSQFRWLRRLQGSDGEEVQRHAGLVLDFACGAIRGALANLGLDCTVNAEIKAIPSCTFVVKIH